MNRTSLIVLLLALSFLGMADAWYLAQAALDGAALSCDFGAALDGCNTVAQSPYSRLFGIPLGLYGVAFYGLIFVASALPLIAQRRAFFGVLYVLSILGVLMSVAFLYVQFVLIKAVCVYCIASAVIAGLVFLLAHVLWKRSAPPAAAAVAEPS